MSDTNNGPYSEKYTMAGEQDKCGGQAGRKGVDHKIFNILKMFILMVKAVKRFSLS